MNKTGERHDKREMEANDRRRTRDVLGTALCVVESRFATPGNIHRVLYRH